MNDQNPFSLADIDECLDPELAARCVPNAECCNLPAHYVCKCKEGFEGKGDEECRGEDPVAPLQRLHSELGHSRVSDNFCAVSAPVATFVEPFTSRTDPGGMGSSPLPRSGCASICMYGKDRWPSAAHQPPSTAHRSQPASYGAADGVSPRHRRQKGHSGTGKP